MSIEQIIAANTVAIEALTAALIATTNLAPSGDKPAADKPAAAKPAAKAAAAPKGPTREEMVTLLTKLKDEQGADAAKGVVKAAGGVVKMADIPDGKIKAVYEAAKTKLEGAEEPAAEDDDI